MPMKHAQRQTPVTVLYDTFVRLNAVIVKVSCPPQSPPLSQELRAGFDDGELSSLRCPLGFPVV
jgi:hypothetical protein